jgi:ribokinase
VSKNGKRARPPSDTTGAGDAFVGSFARFFADGLPVEAALEQAARYAADSVTRRGTQKAYSTAEQFKTFCDTLPPQKAAAAK